MARRTRQKVLLGLDVGGTDLKLGIVSLGAEVLWSAVVPMDASHGKRGVRASLASAVATLSEVCRDRFWRASAAGIGFPGIIHRGHILLAPPQIPRVKGLDLAGTLEELAQVPADAENDATAAAYGEVRAGAGAGCERALVITVGTALGGGLVLDGRLQRGARGTAGEIGHMIFQPEGLACPFNGEGCLELYASATALRRIYREGGGAEGVEAKEIFREAKNGEDCAVAAVDQMARNLGIGLASAANLIAPELIIIGGGVASAGGFLMTRVRRAFRERAIPPVARSCRLVRASCGNQAGFIGAALLAREQRLS